MGFVVQGLNEVTVSLAKASADVKDGAAERVERVLDNIVNTAQSIVPVRFGELQGSISRSEVSKGFGSVTGEAGPTANHGRFVEWGTYKDAPQAFMGPALDRHSHELEEDLGDLGEI